VFYYAASPVLCVKSLFHPLPLSRYTAIPKLRVAARSFSFCLSDNLSAFHRPNSEIPWSSGTYTKSTAKLYAYEFDAATGKLTPKV
jgi:hypothetical protein